MQQTMQQNRTEKFPIRTVSEITGVNAVTLRAWERRYGLIKPLRTPKGHRLYSRSDIRLVEEILGRLSQGMSISQVAKDILENAPAAIVDEDSNTWDHYAEKMIAATVSYDEQQLDLVYNDAMSLYPIDIVTSRLLLPLLGELGNRWAKKTGSVAEEHFFSMYLRNKLGARFHHQNLTNQGPKLIMACLPGEHHEFGILLFALTAHSKGYRIKQVTNRTRSEGIVLAGSAALSCQSIFENLESLCRSVSIPVFIGGDVSYSCREDITNANAIPLTHDLAASLTIISDRLQKSNLNT
jgi:DNA-binding transcriptional MerR regulator